VAALTVAANLPQGDRTDQRQARQSTGCRQGGRTPRTSSASPSGSLRRARPSSSATWWSAMAHPCTVPHKADGYLNAPWGLHMGLRDWWDSWFEPPAPDRYVNRPAEFRHRCPLPRPRSSGTRWVCSDCRCPWVVQSGYTVSAEKVVMCDSQRPWLGTTREPVTYWNEKLNWQFDWATYSGRRSSLD
jgi:hypothetical protein